MMDDGSFDDMLFKAISNEGSSQESLTASTDDFNDLLGTTGVSQTTLFHSEDDLFTNYYTDHISGMARKTETIADPSHRAISNSQEPSTKVEEMSPSVRDRNWVIKTIELVFESIVDALLEKNDKLSISLKTRSGSTGRRIDPTNGIVTVDGGLQTRSITFPGSTAHEAWRFTVLVRILELVHDALTSNAVITKRDIYYRSPDLFVKQAVVDRYVDDIACTFGISRNLLNVSAAAKGLMVGNFSIRRLEGTAIDGLTNREVRPRQSYIKHPLTRSQGTLVPNLNEDDILEVSTVRWIVVVEKEATFRSLVHSNLWVDISSQGILLTAKGYPDLETRAFLRELTTVAPHIPLYAMMDFDPDGLAILSTYKHGSYSLAHENSHAASFAASRPLNLPQIRWIGVKSCHLTSNSVLATKASEKAVGQAGGLLKLTTRDRHKARKMLEWDVLAEDGPEPEWRAEIQRMLLLNVKAEMQILEEHPGGSGKWLKGELGLL
ncbi:DNA topoisomerase IV, alpha subunit [Lophium mytilinum]|uniref:DNA topoisomerase (ATP-hydrolyzing) n=1 Tax=Lophium mytilinum TaxID=390894 RepID=A0A6A6Q7S0_9PEZI|nr:DNA topoisomerase IV, alpha subunit [Lophium mytilinum]